VRRVVEVCHASDRAVGPFFEDGGASGRVLALDFQELSKVAFDLMLSIELMLSEEKLLYQEEDPYPLQRTTGLQHLSRIPRDYNPVFWFHGSVDEADADHVVFAMELLCKGLLGVCNIQCYVWWQLVFGDECFRRVVEAVELASWWEVFHHIDEE
jgi:hypothetical protein